MTVHFTELGADILLQILSFVFKDGRRDRIILPWMGETPREGDERPLFPGPHPEGLLELASLHSTLAEAARPFIWRKVSVLFEFDQLEKHEARLKIAQKPSNARHVRALFVSYAWYGNNSGNNKLLATAIQTFSGLRAVCIGGFQGYTQHRLDDELAKSIQNHSRIDTIILSRMQKAADIIRMDSPMIQSLDLEICHGGTLAAIARPLALRYLCHENVEPVGLGKHLRATMWETLVHLDLGRMTDIEGHTEKDFISSLQKFSAEGRTPALQHLHLSRFSKLEKWLEVARDITLRSFRNSKELSSLKELSSILKTWPQLLRLHICVPDDIWYVNDDAAVLFDMAPVLKHHASLSRLIVDIPAVGDDDSEDEITQEDLAFILALGYAKSCENLQSVQLLFEPPYGSFSRPKIIEWVINRRLGKRGRIEVYLEAVAPRWLEETPLAFLEW